MTAVESQRLAKYFGKTCAVYSASFTLPRGEFMALLGPSGCGKTTMLRMIAGLEKPDKGKIFLDGHLVASEEIFVPANRRRVGMVFQDYALFPHMTVEKNIAYGLVRGSSQKVIVDQMLELVGLSGMKNRYPRELSGGQQQRVALARALAPQPSILLLDEPFSNLDTALRVQVREEVKRIIKEAGVSTILVTHDQDEAMSMADTIGVMLRGTIEQIGSPRILYEKPKSLAIANFLGETNHIPGEAQGNKVLTALGELPLQTPMQGSVEVLLRPSDLVFSSNGHGTPAMVSHTTYYGHRQTIWVKIADATLLKMTGDAHTDYKTGDTIQIGVKHPVVAFPRYS